MKEVYIADLKPGQVLAKAIKRPGGAVILESGTRLTARYIEKLRQLGIKFVFIESETISSKLPIARSSYEERKKALQEANSRKDNAEARKQACDDVLRFAESDAAMRSVFIPSFEDRFWRQFRMALLEIVHDREIAEELAVLRQTDRFLFDHSLRVSMYASMVGVSKNYDFSRLRDLTLGALMFDIGMTRLPHGLIKSRRKLSEDEMQQLRQHTTLGYQVLNGIKSVSEESAKCALLHHERYRGEGYPYGLKQNAIPEFAQIVAIADVYDALLSPRHHRKAYTPAEAVEYLFASGNYEFDLELVQRFVRHIAVYPVRTVIRLNSGQIGVVSTMGSSLNHRPVVRIISEPDGARVSIPYEIDLSRRTDLVIVQTLQEEAKEG